MKDKKIIQLSIRIDKKTLDQYKIWLIKNGYRSINQHINEIIKEIIEKENNEKHNRPKK